MSGHRVRGERAEKRAEADAQSVAFVTSHAAGLGTRASSYMRGVTPGGRGARHHWWRTATPACAGAEPHSRCLGRSGRARARGGQRERRLLRGRRTRVSRRLRDRSGSTLPRPYALQTRRPRTPLPRRAPRCHRPLRRARLGPPREGRAHRGRGLLEARNPRGDPAAAVPRPAEGGVPRPSARRYGPREGAPRRTPRRRQAGP
jgi:hypothetical protein